jgi:hypothetical protein
MLHLPQTIHHGNANRCAFCEGKFGLIRHYRWRTAFCSKRCIGCFKARRTEDRNFLRRLQVV